MNLPEAVQQFSDDFDRMCIERHEMGAVKYGPVNFLSVDTLEMMAEEIVDFANYARYLYIKLRLMQVQGWEQPPAEEPQVPGIQGWRSK